MNRTREEKLDFNKVLPIFAIVFVDMLGLTVILPLLHIYAAAFGADALTIGLLAATYPAMQFIGAPLLGRLSDRYGRKPVLMISQFGTFAGFVILALANSLWLVFLSRIIDGISGANIAVAQAALTDVTTEKTRTQGLGLTGAAFGLAFIIGPVIAILSLAISDNNYALPAASAAFYSLMALGLTWRVFKETHLPEERGKTEHNSRFGGNPMGAIVRALFNPLIGALLVLMFVQQFVFFGFESLLGLFTLNRLAFTGTGNALLFIFVGVILVMVQVRYIGRWSRQHGDRRVIYAGLGLLALGLSMTAITPEQPLPGYNPRRMANAITETQTTRDETLSPRDIQVDLPDDDTVGFGGVLWLAVAIVPVAVGAAVLRPSINSLITKRVDPREVGGVLGVSAALVSSANALTPVIGGTIFEEFGSTAPFMLGGGLLVVLLLFALRGVRPGPEEAMDSG